MILSQSDTKVNTIDAHTEMCNEKEANLRLSHERASILKANTYNHKSATTLLFAGYSLILCLTNSDKHMKLASAGTVKA